MMRWWPLIDSSVQHGEIVVSVLVKPTPLTRSYRIRVTLRDHAAPHVHVVSPKLERRPQEPNTPIPHTYEYDTPGKEQPCLYHPRSGEWTPDMPVALSIMPWLLSWLLDYEYWYVTGEWLGGGIPHGSRKTREDPPRADV